MARAVPFVSALAACAALVSAQSVTYSTAPAFTYVSGRDTIADAAVDSAFWHDTSSQNLVVKLALAVTSSDSSAFTLATPATGFVKLSSRQASARLSTDVAVSSPSVSSGIATYTVTFKSTAYGAYKVSFDCTKLATTGGAFSSACSPSVYSVNVGFTPALSIQRAGVAVQSTWLDSAETAYKLVVGVGSQSSAFDATQFNGALPASASTTGLSSTAAANSALLNLTGGSASVSTLAYGLDLSTVVPGTYAVAAAQGAFLRTDGVASVAATVPLKVGWKPVVTFNDPAMAGAADTSANAGAAYWFNAALSAISLVVATPSTDLNLTGTVVNYGVGSGQLLAGSPALPGASARPNGITSTGATATVAAMTYPLAITGLRPGKYAFNIPQGVITSWSSIGNAAITAELKIGYVPGVRITQANTTVVTNAWLDPLVATYTLEVLPSAGAAFAAQTAPAGPDVFTTADFSFAAGTPTTSAVPYSLTILNATAATQTVAISANQFKRADGVFNTFTSTVVRVGFYPDINFQNAAGVINGWFSAKSGNAILTVGADGLALSGTPPAYSLTGLFAGMAQLPGSAVVTGGIPTAGAPINGSGLSFNYPLALATVPAGTYEFKLPSGVVCAGPAGAPVCNAPGAGTLNVGFDMSFEIFSGSGASKKLERSWFDAASPFSIVAHVGNGKSWAVAGGNSLALANGSITLTFDGTLGTKDGVDEVTLDVADPTASPFTGIATPGRKTFPVPQGSVLRNDGVQNAAGELVVLSGFAPTLTFSDGSATDPWFAPSATSGVFTATAPNGVVLDVAAAVTASTYPFALPFTAFTKTTGTATAAAVAYSFANPAAGFKAGQYGVNFPAGSFASTTGAGSVASSANFKVGFLPQITLADASGNDVTTAWVRKDATLLAKVNIVCDVTPCDYVTGVATAFASNATANTAAKPQAGPLGSTLTTTGGLAVVDTAAQGIVSAVGASQLIYAYPITAAGATAGPAFIAVAAETYCTAGTDATRVCNAAVNQTVNVGADLTAASFTASTGEDYAGLLDADGDVDDATISKPMAAARTAVIVKFTGAFYPAPTSLTAAQLAEKLELPAGFSVASGSQPASTASLFQVRLAVSSTVPNGAYDVSLVPGAFTTTSGGAVYNANATVRVQLGWDVQLKGLTTENGAVVPGSLLPRNKATGAFFTSANDAFLVIRGASSADTFKLTEVLKAVTDSEGKDVKGAIVGLMDTPVSTTGGLVYQIGIKGLPEDTYSFVISGDRTLPVNGDITQGTKLNTLKDAYGFNATGDVAQAVVIDRTAPATAALTVPCPAYAGFGLAGCLGGGFGSLFRDANGAVTCSNTATPAAAAVYATPVVGDLAGLSTVPCARLQAASPLAVPWPAGTQSFSLIGTDQAGNTATGTVSIKASQPVTGVLTVVDARNVQSRSNVVVKPATSGAVSVTVVLDLDTAVRGVTGSQLRCTLLKGQACSSATVITVANGNTLSRRFSFAVTLGAADVAAVRDEPSAFVTFTLAKNAAIMAADGAPVSVRDSVSIQVDAKAPSAPYMYTPNQLAVVGAPVHIVPPTGLFADDFTAKDAIKITAAQPASAFGITFSPNTQGKWTISGTPQGVPVGGKVAFDITAEDAAGNAVTAKSAVVVTIVAAPASPASLTVATSTLTFTEGSADVAVDANARFTFAGGIRTIVMRLRYPEGAGEMLTATGLDTAVYTVTNGYMPHLAGAYEVRIVPAVVDHAFTATEVQNAIKALSYSNTRTDVTSGFRSVFIGLRDARSAVVASASRLINVRSANTAPVVTALTAAAGWSEGTCTPVRVFTGAASFDDSDDTDFTAVTVSIAMAAGTGFVGCNVGKDFLRMAPVYAYGANPLQAIWSASACTLTLRPVAPLASAPIEAFEAAVGFIEFGSSCTDPANGVTDSSAAAAKRSISITLTDNGAANRVPSNAVSAASVFPWALTLINNAPVVSLAKAYGPGGFLASSDAYANTKTELVNGELLRIPKFVAKLPAVVPAGNAPVAVAITMDLTKVSNGVFAKGAITDVDTYEPLGADAVAITALDADANPVALGSLASSSAAVGSSTFSAVFTSASTFAYSATGPSVVTLYFKPNAPTVTVPFAFTYGSASVAKFYVDVRVAGCVLSDAENLVADATLAYPDNSLCTYPKVAVDATSTTPVAVDRGGFSALKRQLADAAADLAALGTPPAQQYAALAALRAAARGSSQVTVDPSSLLSSGSISLGVVVASSTTTSMVAQLPTAPGQTLDTSLALKLSPAGARFSKPVRVCINIGDTPSGKFAVLVIASQADAADESRGYSGLEVMTNQYFDRATGQLCGDTDHFSVVLPGLSPEPLADVVSKAHLMGGSCPNGCSGRGQCKQEGKCACNQGFWGNDCSLRSCPAAESWGESGSLLPHKYAECAGRGVCDRSTGTCACFAGYEGAACDRTACPNSCSGHGVCRTVGELVSVAAAGYSSWESSRIQKCVCDAGYTGADCSERTCAFGDDPETVCAYTGRQVQKVTVGFDTDPTDPTGTTLVDAASDEMTLAFTSVEGKRFNTPTVAGFFAGGAAASTFKSALVSLPEFAITDVDVTVSKTPLSVAYEVAFTGATNTGNEKLLQCPVNADGVTMGCPGAACRPQFKQLRMFFKTRSTAVHASAGLILQQPAAVAGGNTAATPNKWGVETALVLTKSDSGNVTFRWADSAIYGTPAAPAAEVNTVDQPLPPQALRSGMAGPYGLRLDLGDDSTVLAALAGQPQVTIQFKWRLPTCKVEEVRAADKDSEKAECSNRGTCDRASGKCTCFDGYSGYACNAQVVYV